jgi:aryl carrier-like protein
MGAGPELTERLRRLPRSERATALADSVLAEFRAALLMSNGEPLSSDESYFDLGLTSVSLMKVKESLEVRLGRDIDTTALFNYPTVRQLLDHLAGDVLADLFVA